MTDNYFTIFDLPQQFDVDLNALDAKYFELQKVAHPDMSGGNEVNSAQLNHAYKTLRNRFKRAEYIIELQGKNALLAPPELLMEMLELREKNSPEKLAQVKAEIENLFAAFAKKPTAEIFVRIKYLNRFLEENI